MMLSIYRSLLLLYPADHRRQFGEEMIAVVEEVQSETLHHGVLARASFCIREIAGLLTGAAQEHLRSLGGNHIWLSFPKRRLTMHSEFRFPKATYVLMTIILAGVVMAIEKARAIEASVPNVDPHIGPIQPEHFTFFPTIALVLAFFYAAGMIGWAILFSLRRSGVHRLADMSTDPK